jgi:thioredoxin 1
MGKFDELINGDQPILVDFFAEWCGPCKAMAPELEKVAQSFKGKAKVIKVDIDKNPAAANQYKIMGVPTFILFKKGQIRWRQSGMLSAKDIGQAIQNEL